MSKCDTRDKPRWTLGCPSKLAAALTHYLLRITHYAIQYQPLLTVKNRALTPSCALMPISTFFMQRGQRAR